MLQNIYSQNKIGLGMYLYRPINLGQKVVAHASSCLTATALGDYVVNLHTP